MIKEQHNMQQILVLQFSNVYRYLSKSGPIPFGNVRSWKRVNTVCMRVQTEFYEGSRKLPL